MSKLELFRKIVAEHERASKWIDSIPPEIRNAYFDNPYVGAFANISDMLMAAVFTADELVAVEWWLYEWNANNDLYISLNDMKFKFETLDGYCAYLEAFEDWT